MVIARLFTEHPHSVGESYAEHLCTATGFGVRMLLGGLACLIHAWLPFAFERTASHCICELHDRMVVHRTVAHRTMLSRAARR
jgi:hypothetical protein